MKIIPIIRNNETKPVQIAYMNTLASDIMGVANRLEKAQDLAIAHIAGQNLRIISEQVENLLNSPLHNDRNYKKQMLFLACPYTAETEPDMYKNYLVSIHATIFLMRKGFNVYNPLAHGCGIIEQANCDNGFVEDRGRFVKEYSPYFNWHEMNCRIMEACDALIWLDDVVKTPRSNGMLAEIKHATMLGLPILGMTEQGVAFKIYRSASEKMTPFPVTATIGD